MTISLITQRAFFNNTDISVVTSDFRQGVYAMTSTATDHVYLGSSTPLNNLWIEMSTVSGVNAGAPTVEVWFGQAWVPVVDLIDQTSGMTASGRLSWSLDLFSGWSCEQLSVSVGISGSAVYNRYWLRLSWPNAFTATIAYLGQKFSSDTILQSMYPDLLQPAILAGYKTGKTNWEEQHFMAAEAIVRDLRRRNIIKDKGQILDWTLFEEASAHKVAEIAYRAFGTSYVDHVNMAVKRYEAEMAQKTLVIDENMNGHVESSEVTNTTGWMSR